MLADVVFDLPLDHPFSYRVPDALRVTPGQRVSAPLGGRPRVGVVVALRPDADLTLKPLQSLVEPAPILSKAGLELGRWIADESLSSWGSTLSALLPPPPRGEARRGPRSGRRAYAAGFPSEGGALDRRRA